MASGKGKGGPTEGRSLRKRESPLRSHEVFRTPQSFSTLDHNPFLGSPATSEGPPTSPREKRSKRGSARVLSSHPQGQPPRSRLFDSRNADVTSLHEGSPGNLQEDQRTLRSGRKYSIASSGPARNPNARISTQKAQTPEAESACGDSASTWLLTPSDFLLEAALQSNRANDFNLSKDRLKQIVVGAQSWILERTQPDHIDYAQLASRIIEEGVLSVLIYVAAAIDRVPEPSQFLNPFGNSIDAHFLAAKSVVNGLQLRSRQSGEENSFTSTGSELANSKPTFADIRQAPGNLNFVSMATPTIDRFLAGLAQVASSGNAEEVREWLPIEPPFLPTYEQVIVEMRARYPPSIPSAAQAIVRPNEVVTKTDQLLSSVKTSTGDEWTGFSSFVAQYLCYIRDVDPRNLLDTYDKLTELMTKCNSALNTPDVGVVMLPTTVAIAKVFARLAIGLEKQPELIAHLVEAPTDEGGESMSLPERAGNTVRNGFIACLNENAQYPPNQPARPVGRHAGIYKLANICLKIFFRCNKTKSAEQIFMNIGAKSPPIDIYPRSERVTYLYYLGRFFFSVNHFYRAQSVLQAAYNDCHVKARSQRRLILIYLATSNMVLGRFPSESIYQRPEAKGFRERFQPICNAIRKGDLPTFRRLTAMDNEHAEWFLFHRLFLQIRSRCEVLVWRTLCRRVWLLVGNKGDREAKRPPFLDLEDFVHAAKYLESRALNPLSQSDGGPGNRHTNWVFMSQEPPKDARYIDPDFEGLEEDEEFFDEEGVDEYNQFLLPGMTEVESIVSSLIGQGLVNGYVSTAKKLAILGAGKKEAVEAGWPNVWQIIKARCEASGTDVPGWKRAGSGGFGGMVVNLSSAKAAGM